LHEQALVRTTLLVSLLGCVLLAPSPTAAAVVSDTDIHFRIFRLDAMGNQSTIDAAALSREFAQAVCLCQNRYLFEIYLSATVAAKVGSLTGGNAELWAGTNCNDTGTTTSMPRDQRCVQLARTTLSRFTQTQSYTLTADQFLVATVNDMVVSCAQQQVTPGLWLLVDENNDGMYEAKAKLDIPYDGLPPSEPINQSALSGNEAIELNWDLIGGNDADVDSFQILCARGNALQVFKDGTYTAAFKTITSVCPNNPNPLPPPIGTTGPDAGVGVSDAGATPIILADLDAGTIGSVGIPPYGPFLTIDSHYVCSERLAKTVRSERIRGLQNGIPYEFAVVAIDKVGNPSAITSIQLAYPQGDEDAWTHYRNLGGQASGGFCTVTFGTRSGMWSAVLVALLALLALGVRHALRRRR
jgi:hypothetical protein